MIKSDIEYWLALKYVPRLAVHKKIKLVQSFGLATLFHQADHPKFLLTSKQQAALQHPPWDKIAQIIQACQNDHCELISYDDLLYPLLLKQIYDPPLVLFAKGNPKLLNTKQLAIVGSRSATVTGRENGFLFASQLSKQGFTITSGLALGIDAAAHRGALNVQGHTIAVVATGLDKTYPSRHKILAQEIIDSGGLLLSEFIPGTLPKAGHFPKRNRIISGLSLGVVIIEAEIKSGSLITARCALEQNREVFAVPGAIANPMVKGCHHLIKQGAKLVENYADIILELNTDNDVNLAKINNKNNQQQDLFNDSLLVSVGYEVTPIDTVVSRSKLPVEEVLSRLTILELKGLVVAAPGGYVRLNRG